jgi:hypothetical protein
MKSPMSLWCDLANESARWCCTSAARDCKTVTDRVKAEGLSFLTITLPQYARAFERALELGSIDIALFSGFHCRGGFPEFLRGFLCQIFDSSGSLLDEPSIDCISAIRQLTLVFSKIEMECSDARKSLAMRKYVEIEEELQAMDTSSFEEFLPQFQKASTLLWADVFSEVENSLLETHQLVGDWPEYAEEKFSSMPAPITRQRGRDAFLHLLPASLRGPDIQSGEIDSKIVDPASREILVPRHGPGATADRLRGNAKFTLSEWPLRIENVFPYGDYALPSWRSYYQLDRVAFLEPGAERPVKVVSVPKTPKTVRIIAEEPAAVQYCQQALSHRFVDAIEDHSKVSPSRRDQSCDFGRLFVGFHEQEPNRLLAQSGSINGRLATLDLSEASDRVLNRHVELLFERFPRLSEAIQATRSTKADVPGHGVIPLAKFASMGSALCFPVEAMVFVTIVFVAIAIERREPLSRRLLSEMVGMVRVYGDDIIVPVEYVDRVCQLLEAFGLKVNMDKSFWNGKFRESCGGDYYDGEWVTPIRLRHMIPSTLDDVDEVVGLVAFRNLLYWNGFWDTARKLDDELTRLFRGDWNIVEKTAEGLGRESVFRWRLRLQEDRIHPRTHVPLVRGARVRSTTPDSPISGEGALLKFLFRKSYLPFQDPKHLERQGRPAAVGIKRGWIRPY